METETQMVARLQRSGDLKLLRALRKVARYGEVGRGMSETLTIADLIRFGGPREGVNPYNCYHLTHRGADELTRLNAELIRRTA